MTSATSLPDPGYPIGSLVRIANGEIKAVVCGLLYRAKGEMSYEVIWWIDGKRNIEWLHESEVTR